MARVDPLRGFRFLVEIDGVVHGAFMRVKGLSREVKLETRRAMFSNSAGGSFTTASAEARRASAFDSAMAASPEAVVVSFPSRSTRTKYEPSIARRESCEPPRPRPPR